MESVSFSFSLDDQKPKFTTISESKATVTTEPSFTQSDIRGMNAMNNPGDSVFSPLAAPFQSRSGNDLLAIMAQQEPHQGDTAPTQAEVDLMNYRMHGSDLLFDDMEQHSGHNFYTGSSRPESVASSSNMWSEGSGLAAGRNGEMIDTFDFLIKSISSANHYVSMLTREQLSVLSSFRPSLLYEFLQEVVKVRGEKRMRRPLPNECAFCKNNGENEEYYTKHVLKDWRGRVLCPVLRAFRCPRCGATGDRAHTIKYCPENNEKAASDRGGLSSRRRAPPLVLGTATGLPRSQSQVHSPLSAPPAPSPSPATPTLAHASLWGNYGMN